MFKRCLFPAILLLTMSGVTLATPISISDFSGTEQIETFGSVPYAPISNPFYLNGVTYISADYLMSQSFSFAFTNIQATGDFNTLNTHGLGQLTIDFGSTVSRAGLLLSSADVLTWSVTARDAGLNILETAIYSQPSSSNAVFAGFENLVGIRRLDITNTTPSSWFTFFDDVRYERVQVPEPATLGLLFAGLIYVTLMRRRSA